MRWLLICLIGSVLALLLAGAGLARHIWLQHRKGENKPAGNPGSRRGPGFDATEEIDVEPET
jgi:hypothetical protein